VVDGEELWACEGEWSEYRLGCWSRLCVYVRVCGMSMCGLMVCDGVRMVWGGVACGKGVCGSAHVLGTHTVMVEVAWCGSADEVWFCCVGGCVVLRGVAVVCCAPCVRMV
jgi:hypothetical protein